MKKIITLLIIQGLFFSILNAQEKSKITGTNLQINLKDGFVIDGNSPSMSNQDYAVSFMEIEGVNFYDEFKDFRSIEGKYAEKGISVKKNYLGELGKYKAQFITLESVPAIYQIFFGDSTFSTIVNVIAVDSTMIIDETAINTFLSSIEYQKSEISPLEEHANFVLVDKTNKWFFEKFFTNIFAFTHQEKEDALLIMQFPAVTSELHSKEDLANRFIEKFKVIPNSKIVEKGNYKIDNLEGYRVVFNIDENEEMGLIYLFVFASDKSVFVFQGMGQKNDENTRLEYETLLKNLELK